MKHPKDLLDDWCAGRIDLAPITSLLGIRPIEMGPGTAKIEMTADARHHNAMGTVHGGVFCDLADVAIGAAMAPKLDEGHSFTTVALQISYFRPVVESTIVATATLVRQGRTTAYLECDLHDADGRHVAKATSTCAIMPMR